jgi:hypothetical protein
VWDDRYDPFTNLIDVYVGRLRRKVDGLGAVPLIHTRRGAGYILTDDDGPHAEAQPSGGDDGAPAADGPPGRGDV